MSEPSAPSADRHQILADPSGRRRRRLALAGRAATAVLSLWLVTLTLGGFGLQPLAGLPIVGDLGAGGAVPALPKRVQVAVRKGTTVVSSATLTAPSAVPGVPSRGPAATTPSRPRTRHPAQTTPAKAAPQWPTTTPAGRPVTPARTPTTTPATTLTTTTTHAHAPAKPVTSPATTAPGRTKTAPGPPTTTPGTTPAGNGGQGKSSDHNPTRTTP